MNTLLSTTMIALSCAALLLGLQRSKVSSLREQTETLRGEIQEIRSPSTADTSSPTKSTALRTASTAQRGSERNRKPVANANIDEVQAGIEALIESLDFSRPEPRLFLKILPGILELVADCNGEDLEKIAERLGNPDAGEGPGDMFAMVLKVLAIEYDPARFVKALFNGEAGDHGMDRELRTAALAAWARQDPDAVLTWLLEDGAEVSGLLNRGSYVAIGARLIKGDLDKAVQFFKEIESSNRIGALNAIAGTRSADPYRMIDAARGVEESALRRELLQVGVASVFTREGIEAGREAIRSISDAADREQTLAGAAASAMEARPVETMNWLMSDEDERVERALDGAIQAWARADFRAAATWLGEQSASGRRDRTLAAFSRAIHYAEPESSLSWAGEISDPEIRERVVRERFSQWEARDQDAARAWKEKQ